MRGRRVTYHLRVLLIQVVLLLAGCGTATGRHNTLTLTYWYTNGAAAASTVNQLIARFEQQNPTIRVSAHAVDLASTYGEFVAAVRSGQPPDALRISASWTAALANAGYLLDLDQFVVRDTDFLPVPLMAATWRGRLYGLPQETDLLALYYNKALFQAAHLGAPPATWAAFDADNRALTTASQYGWSFEGSAYIAQAFLYGFGGGLADTTVAPPRMLIDDPASLAGLNALKRELAYAPPVDFTTGHADAVNSFKAGTSAMLLDGSWDYANLSAGDAFHTPGTLGVAAIPFDPACCDATTPRAVAGGQNYAVAAASPHAAAAARFIAFMASTSSQAAIVQHDQTLPTRLSVYTNAAVQTDPAISSFVPLLPTQIARPISPAGDQLYAPDSGFDTELRAYLTGAEDAPTAAHHIAQSFQQLLSG